MHYIMFVAQRQWLLILEEAKRKKMALDNQRKETAALQHDTPPPDAPGMLYCIVVTTRI